MEDKTLQAQAHIYKFMFGFVDSMVLRSAIELSLADIIHAHGQPMTLGQIISSIGTPSPDATFLERMLRFLVRHDIFKANPQPDSGETLYGLTPSSRWILRGSEFSLAPMVLVQSGKRNFDPWHHFSDCVREGGLAFEKAHGLSFYEYGARNPDFGKKFNDAMECSVIITFKGIMEQYTNGFEGLGSIVDVGGGTGAAIAEIVRAHPHIKGTNFDQPHVIAIAPEYSGVTHVGGDMFVTIPKADAIFMKWILHNWSDEDCIRILKNCHESLQSKSGKVIIVEIVLDPEGEGMFDDTGFVFDLLMLAYGSGGKERTKLEWGNLLNKAGFARHSIIKIAALPSIIEAYID